MQPQPNAPLVSDNVTQEAFSYAQLAKRYGVTTRTLRRWRADGRLKPALTTGARVTRLIPVQADHPTNEAAS